jgi:hypothetical protein
MNAINWKKLRWKMVHKILLDLDESCVQRKEKKVMVCIRNVLFPVQTSKYTEVILTCIKQGNRSTKPVQHKCTVILNLYMWIAILFVMCIIVNSL